ncbi:MAG: hypothetical protein MR425_09600, partial [Lachnospiraceae bacterium]|nr:hypothetical protein [Lachnospiraceae bacterium]
MRQRKRVLAAVLSFLMLFGTDNSMNIYASEITGENLGSPMQSVEETETETQEETKTENAAAEQSQVGEQTEGTEATTVEQNPVEEQSETAETERAAAEQTGEAETEHVAEEQIVEAETEQATGEQSPVGEQTGAAGTQNTTEEQTKATESRNVTSVQKENGLQILYLVLQKTALQPADSQFILLGLNPGEAQIQNMVLRYRNRDTGADYRVQQTELTSDAAFFQMDHLEGLAQGIYDLTGITYTTLDMPESEQTLAFSDIGITASFGIGEEPANTPDAVITT